MKFQTIRTQDVINQLLIRTLDIKTSSEVIDAKNELENKQEKDLECLSSTSSQSVEEISILDEKTNDTSDKKLVNIFSTCSSNESNSSSFKMFSKSCRNNSLDAMHNSNSCKDLECEDSTSEILTLSQSCVLENNQPDESSISKIIASEKSCTQEGNYHTSKHILHEPELQLLSGVDGDISAVDPLRLTSTLDCSDEYVNINVLDNPNFVKNISDNSNSPTSKKSIINESKTDDSDIEILEHIEISKDNTKNNTKNKEDKLNQKSDKDIKETSNADSVESNAEKQQVDAAHTSVEASNPASKTRDKSEKPLTLEDIKDTGFTGNQLYKCGYENCDYNALNAAILRIHIKKCTHRTHDKNLNCTHCGKRFVKIGFLLEHLKLHGLKRFGCSLCKARCTVSYQAMAHMRTKHKIQYSKVIPADPENPSADGLFIVQPIVSRH